MKPGIWSSIVLMVGVGSLAVVLAYLLAVGGVAFGPFF